MKDFDELDGCMYDFHFEIFWDLVERLGYLHKLVCPRCLKYDDYKMKNLTVLRCGKCHKTFSPLSKTIFANSKFPLPFYLNAILLICDNPKIKLTEIMGELGCTNTTACNIRRKIRTIKKTDIEFILAQKYKREIDIFFKPNPNNP